MQPGDQMIWHPLMLGDEYWTVEIVRAGEPFCTVKVTHRNNPDGTREGRYIARVEELHPVQDFTPASGRYRSPMETAYA